MEHYTKQLKTSHLNAIFARVHSDEADVAKIKDKSKIECQNVNGGLMQS